MIRQIASALVALIALLTTPCAGQSIQRADRPGCYVLAQSAVAAAALTGTTSKTTIATIALSAGALGANGRMRIESVWSMTNSANVKTMTHDLAGTALKTAPLASSGQLYVYSETYNRNAQSSQMTPLQAAAGTLGASTGSPLATSIDTSAAQNITITGQLANSGETLTLEGYSVTICPRG